MGVTRLNTKLLALEKGVSPAMVGYESGDDRDTYEACFCLLYMHCSTWYWGREETILPAFTAFCFLISVGVGMDWADGAVLYTDAHMLTCLYTANAYYGHRLGRWTGLIDLIPGYEMYVCFRLGIWDRFLWHLN